MPKKLSTSDTILQFLRENPGQHSIADIGRAVFLAHNTLSQHALFLAHTRKISRRLEGTGRGKHYVYWIEGA